MKPNSRLWNFLFFLAATFYLVPGLSFAADQEAEKASSSKIQVDLGATYRFRLENYDNFLFGLTPVKSFTSHAHRFLIDSDIKFGSRLRVFVQLGAYIEDGRKPGPRPFDESEPDFQQIYIEYQLPVQGVTALLRIGRTEMPLGTSKLIGTRDGPNIRLSFDAISLDVTNARGTRFRAFFGRPVLLDRDAFGDETDKTEAIWGVYLTFPEFPVPALAADIYYLGRSEENELYFQGVADETRHSVGFRIYGSTGRFDMDVEALYQFGSFGAGKISAWGMASQFRYLIIPKHQVKIGLRVNSISGDKDASDPNLQTFNALFPNLAYMTEAATLAPANLFAIVPFVEVSPREGLLFLVGLNLVRRNTSGDAIYRAGYFPLVLPGQSTGGGVVADAYLEADWKVSKRLLLSAAFSYGFAGSVVSGAGGKDRRFIKFSATFPF